MNKLMKALGVFMLIPALGWAQSDEDALRYSQLTFGGTARYVGLGGAFGALGADFPDLFFFERSLVNTTPKLLMLKL